jgi:hypothetical protein
MKTTLNFDDFYSKFQKLRSANFSDEGLKALYNHLSNYENETEDEIELDVIALCCQYAEYESLEEFQIDYGDEYETIEEIRNRTIVIPIDDDSFIIQVF